MSGDPRWRSAVRSMLIGIGAALGLSALGLDTSVSLSTYGLYLGPYGPLFVIVALPVFINLAFAFALLKADQRLMKYSMITTSLLTSLVAGYAIYVGVFQSLIAAS